MVIDRVKRGDTEAYGAIVRAYQHDVWRVAAFALSGRDESEDLVQQAFVVAYQRIDDYERGRDFGAWVRGIARNLVRDHVRRRAREDRRMMRYLSHLEAQAGEDEAADAREETLREALVACREKLSEPARDALALRYERAQSFTRIAAAIGRTVAGARQLLQRTRMELRHCIQGRLA